MPACVERRGLQRLTLTLLFAAGASAAAPRSIETFAVDLEPGFQPVRSALGSYLDAQAARTGTHRFCVIGYRHPPSAAGEGGRLAWVYWHDGQRLIHWEPAADGIDSKETLTRSRRDLDLRRDVVATERELAGSSYRIDRTWLRRLLADCRQRGQRFEIRRP